MTPQRFQAKAASAAMQPTVVLLHASASSARQWAGLFALLADRYDVHAPDFHGHGARPDWPGHGPLTLADEVALVAPRPPGPGEPGGPQPCQTA
jgi:pimeloyl-ACP methyl ester carboxylesterase